MQKFTRALTREIEVNGERLAITFDEKGLSIRSIGSRKPPAELTWAAVVETASGTASASAPKALAALEKPASMAELLPRLDGWLKQHRKRFHAGLRPGAADKQLAALATALSKPVPDDLAAWLRWRDGQDEEFIGSFLESFNLMSTAEIVEALKERKGEKGWNPAFVPILDDYQGDHVVVDTSTPMLAVREVWKGRNDHPEAATSLCGWLANVLADFEAGKYHEEAERGEFMRSES